MKKIYIITTLIIATVLSILIIDRPLAIFIEEHLQSLQPAFTKGLTFIELVSGFTISKYLLACLLLLGGVVIYLFKKYRGLGTIFFFIGLTHLASRLIAGTLKNVFDRTRPFQFLEDRTIGDFFVENGSSFPSGHVAHFSSVFIPLILLFPKRWLWLIVIPFFVLLQRTISNDHYLGDTLASILIVVLITIGFYRLFRIRNIGRINHSLK